MTSEKQIAANNTNGSSGGKVMTTEIKKLTPEEIDIEKTVDVLVAAKHEREKKSPSKLAVYNREITVLHNKLTSQNLSQQERNKLIKRVGEIGDIVERELVKIDVVTDRNKPKLDAVMGNVELDHLREINASGPVKASIAETIKANNSIEDMLIDQLAVTHRLSMHLLSMIRNNDDGSISLSKLEKLTNLSCKYLDTYQKGALALHKLQTGGKQEVVVKHQSVQVQNGGQAIVANDLIHAGGGYGAKN